jgi:hypothetical protein
VRARSAKFTYVRDAILFFLGVLIILKQAGIIFPPPEGGVALELLAIGALFCNGPLFLSYLSARGGTSASSPQPPERRPELPSVPPSEQCSEGSP